MTATDSLTITIVYDNNAYDERLKSAGGYAALVDYHDHNLLFDTGGDGSTLVENMRILGVDPIQIESVVLSHIHGDHTGGLSALLELGERSKVYLPPSFSSFFKNQVGKKTEVIEVTPSLSFFEEMYSTGEMGGGICEQALLIQTDKGLVIVTGCAHPGIVGIIKQAKALFDGGFAWSWAASILEASLVQRSMRSWVVMLVTLRMPVRHLSPSRIIRITQTWEGLRNEQYNA